MEFIAFLKALPEVMAAVKGAFRLWKEMQTEAFYRDSQAAFSKLEEAKSDEEIKAAVTALRSVYKRV